MRRFCGLIVVMCICVPVRPQSFEKAMTVAPSLSWTTGTQEQTIWGGSALLSAVRSLSYCDPRLLQFGLAANASDTSTSKLGGTPVVLASNDVRIDATTGVFPTTVKSNGLVIENFTHHYVGIDADFFGNNSLGIGLQQLYAAEYQYRFARCKESHKVEGQRFFSSVGAGAGFLDQRLYATQDSVRAAAFPVSAQMSYLMGKEKGKAPKVIWYALIRFLPVPTDMHAFQISSIAAVKIPTRIPWLSLNFSESDLYMNNAPIGHKRNYQNGNVSLVFAFSQKQKSPDERGACYGGDKLSRDYCFDDVTTSECPAPSLFRAGQQCSAPALGKQPDPPDLRAKLKSNWILPTQ